MSILRSHCTVYDRKAVKYRTIDVVFDITYSQYPSQLTRNKIFLRLFLPSHSQSLILTLLASKLTFIAVVHPERLCTDVRSIGNSTAEV